MQDSSNLTSIEIELCPANQRTGLKQSLAAGQSLILGSADDADIILEQKGIGSRHARLGIENQGVTIRTIDNHPLTLNGQSVQSDAVLQHGDWLVLGSAIFNVRLPHKPTGESTGTPKSVAAGNAAQNSGSIRQTPERKTDSLWIGRTSDCEITIESPIVSSHHAKLSFTNGNWILEDLGSTNGTFLNGELIRNPVALKNGDRVSIAIYSFVFTGDELHSLDDSGRVCIEIRDLFKQVDDRAGGTPKLLLDHINLVIEPGEFVAIFGTSGSGKSTLLDAMNGRRPASGGQVLYNGTDLYQAFDLFRSTIGYVPQQDIVHRKIKIRSALKHTARLRLPPDTSDGEIDDYIVKVLDQVGLREKAELVVDTPVPLSGGQLKRISLAVELVANPNVLFLDEVTSGLDAGTDRKMMRLFAELTATGKTVVCVTHTLESIDECDLVVLLHQGQLVYFGPPGDAPGYFGIERLSDVYELLDSSEQEIWAQQYNRSELYRQYVLERFSEQKNSPSQSKIAQSLHKNRKSWFDWRQASTLMHRYWELILADQKNLVILLLQAPLIAVVIGGVFAIEGTAQEQAYAESRISFILVLSAIWFGCLNSARELVKELPIYLRERSVNLRLLPYVASKMVPLALLCTIQCAILLLVVRLLVPLSGNYLDQFLVLVSSAMAATAMGLTVSALVDSNDKAIAIIPILLIPQVILSNAIVTLEKSAELIAKFSMISFWSFDALKSSLDQSRLILTDYQGQAILPVIGSYSADLLRIGGFFALFLCTTVIGLLLKDRRK